MQVLVVDDGGVPKAAARALREAGETDATPAGHRAEGGEPVIKGAAVTVGRGMTLEIGGRRYGLVGIDANEDRMPTTFGAFELTMDLGEEVNLRLRAWAASHAADAPATDMGAGYRRFEKRRRDGTYKRGRR